MSDWLYLLIVTFSRDVLLQLICVLVNVGSITHRYIRVHGCPVLNRVEPDKRPRMVFDKNGDLSYCLVHRVGAELMTRWADPRR